MLEHYLSSQQFYLTALMDDFYNKPNESDKNLY